MAPRPDDRYPEDLAMRRSLPTILLTIVAVLLVSCASDDNPGTPAVPDYTGLDIESPGVAYTTGFGLAPPDVDHRSFDQLLWDGTLRVDHGGEWPERVHEVQVSGDEVAAVMAIAHTGRLLAILQGEIEPECEEPPTDVTVQLHLGTDDAHYSISTLACDEDVFNDVRLALRDLQQKYLPFEPED